MKHRNNGGWGIEGRGRYRTKWLSKIIVDDPEGKEFERAMGKKEEEHQGGDVPMMVGADSGSLGRR